MTDYIKREDAIEAMENRFADIIRTHKRRVTTGEKAIASDMIETTKMVKSADVAPVRHGHWIHVDDVYDISGMYKGEVWECSECGYRFERLKDSGISMKVCHDCGARMDGGNNEID